MKDPRTLKHPVGHVLPDGTSVGHPHRWWRRRRNPDVVYRLDESPSIAPKILVCPTKGEAKQQRRELIEMARSVGVRLRVRITPMSATDYYGSPPQ